MSEAGEIKIHEEEIQHTFISTLCFNRLERKSDQGTNESLQDRRGYKTYRRHIRKQY